MESRDKIGIIIAFVAIASLTLGIYQQWLIQNPQTSDYLVIKGNNHLRCGEYQRAVECFECALKIHESDTNAWKNKGFALLNLGVDNESLGVYRSNMSPPYVCGKRLIDHYNSCYQATDMSQNYFQRSYECFTEAVYYEPSDPEAWLYKGIVGLYLMNSSYYNPLGDFNKTLGLINGLPEEQQICPPIINFESCARCGCEIAYQKLKRC
jgi:tetratricopeptide (TPR) repeat protein